MLCVFSQTFGVSYICFGLCFGVVYVLLLLLYCYYVIIFVVLLFCYVWSPTHYGFGGKKRRKRIRKGKRKSNPWCFLKESKKIKEKAEVNKKKAVTMMSWVLTGKTGKQEFVLWISGEICF